MSAQLPKHSHAVELALVEDLARFTHDPLGYVMYAFPWGSGELAGSPGPRQWQRDYLSDLGAKMRAGWELADAIETVIQEAVASGHGIGKSALVAWLVLWAMSTFEDTRGIVTANTERQLITKTWPELSKWYRRAINRHWFHLTATAIYSVDKDHERTWRIDIIPWSEHNTEAFAGLHNLGKRLIIIFDEASKIVDKIWEVSEGVTTDADTEIIWAVFGNPTRTTGRFKECFGRFAHRWGKRQIDSRTVEGTNRVQLDKLVADWGEDSDHVRIRVRGVFPRASAMQFISSQEIDGAMAREPIAGLRDPLVMSIDVARGGEDEFVIRYRRGLDAKSIPPIIIPGSETRDSMRMVALVADLALNADRFMRPDAIIVDETGVGGPIVNRLVQLLGDQTMVYGVMFSGASPDPKLANMRAYMYWRLRDAIRGGLCIGEDERLRQEFAAIEFTHDKNDKFILIPKDQIRDEVGFSIDRADSLAISYAYPIAPRQDTQASTDWRQRATTEYDPYSRN